ncbi:F-box protein CPR1-like [Papaver somniferum]|uniref:F-box protein CPR1-like n=1 Tax=Papaver somniferum TaxID=3469 RepID=UPI000E704482|nr:F-box protein CPR1-like [Papaver somniferum]
MKPSIPIAAKIGISSHTRSKVEHKSNVTWSNLQVEIPDEIFLRLQRNPSWYRGIDYVSISSAPSSSSSTPPPSVEFRGAVLIYYPFESNNTCSVSFLGSCNGLVCLKVFRTDKVHYQRGLLHTNYFSIFNPLTRQFREFRTPRNDYWFACGFCYDSNIDDYKLVAISKSDDVPGCSNVDVYKMKLGSWSSIQGTISYVIRYNSRRSRGVFFNDLFIGWEAKPQKKTSFEVICCFDINNEVMADIPLPEKIMPPQDFPGEVHKNMGVWGNCIYVAFIWNPVRMDVWVMQEYGVKESWINIFTTTKLSWPFQPSPFWKPLVCFDNGVILTDTDGKHLLLFDPTTKRVRSVAVLDIAMVVCGHESRELCGDHSLTQLRYLSGETD